MAAERKKKAPTKLTDIALREVSFVDSPANPHAAVILAKRDDSVNKDGPGVGDVHVAGPNISGVKMKKCPVGGCALPLEGGMCPEHGKVGKGLLQKFLETLGLTSSGDAVEDLTKLNETVLSFEKDEKDDEDDTDAGSSGDNDDDTNISMGKRMPDKNEDVLKGLTPAQLEAIEKAKVEAIEKAKAEAKADAEKVAVAKAEVEKTAIEKANAEIEKANTEIRKLQEENASKARLDIAKGLVEKSGVATPEAVSNILKQLDEEGSKQFKEVLAKADKLTEDSKAFIELGKDYGSTSTMETAKAKAAELRKANPALTEQQAISKVYENSPELYDAVLSGN